MLNQLKLFTLLTIAGMSVSESFCPTEPAASAAQTSVEETTISADQTIKTLGIVVAAFGAMIFAIGSLIKVLPTLLKPLLTVIMPAYLGLRQMLVGLGLNDLVTKIESYVPTIISSIRGLNWTTVKQHFTTLRSAMAILPALHVVNPETRPGAQTTTPSLVTAPQPTA